MISDNAFRLDLKHFFFQFFLIHSNLDIKKLKKKVLEISGKYQIEYQMDYSNLYPKLDVYSAKSISVVVPGNKDVVHKTTPTKLVDRCGREYDFAPNSKYLFQGLWEIGTSPSNISYLYVYNVPVEYVDMTSGVIKCIPSGFRMSAIIEISDEKNCILHSIEDKVVKILPINLNY